MNISFLELVEAAEAAARGKRNSTDIAFFFLQLEKELLELERELNAGDWRAGNYRVFYVSEPKRRKITCAPFRDRVVHHVIHKRIESDCEKNFFEVSYACRKGKGSHKAIDKAQEYVGRFNYWCQIDVKKFFASISHVILKTILRKILVNHGNLTGAIDEIIESWRDVEAKPFKISDLDNYGTPIGNLTSQLFANIYLNELDRYAVKVLKLKNYVRYMDNILFFGNSRREMIFTRDWLVKFINERLNLTAHNDGLQVQPTNLGAPFLGFLLYPDYRRILRKPYLRMRRHLRKLEKSGDAKLEKSKECCAAHLAYANTYRINKVRKWESGKVGKWESGKKEVRG